MKEIYEMWKNTVNNEAFWTKVKLQRILTEEEVQMVGWATPLVQTLFSQRPHAEVSKEQIISHKDQSSQSYFTDFNTFQKG